MAAVATHPAQQWASQSASCSAQQQQPSSSSQQKTSRSNRHAEQYDRFYGHRLISELCEAVISALFACPLDSASSSVGQQTITAADGSCRPTPRLAEFIAYALHRTRLPEEITFQALFLLRRLKYRFPAARGSSGHRLFISALMLASKSSCDDTYSNKSWTIVSQGLFSLREVNQMERELFGYLGYKVNVEVEELEAFTNLLKAGQLAAVVDLSVPAPVTPAVAEEIAIVETTPTKSTATIAYPSLRAPAGYTANPAATYSMQQASAASSVQHLSPSMASMSSSRGSFSSASYSMAPSPTALSHSESGSSSRASPDTPASEFDASPYTDDGKATFANHPAGTFDDQYNYYGQVKQQSHYYPQVAQQQSVYHGAVDTHMAAARHGY